MTERTEVQSPLLVALSALPGWMGWRHNTGRLQDVNGRWVSFGCPGSGDIMGCYKGRAVAIECKAARGALSPQQRRFKVAWEAAGGLYVVARDVETALADVVDAIMNKDY